jgi:hypothetical protein
MKRLLLTLILLTQLAVLNANVKVVNLSTITKKGRIEIGIPSVTYNDETDALSITFKYTLTVGDSNNLFNIGSIEQRDSVLKMKITATGNYFSGNTRIYNNKLKNAEYDFRNNTFRSNYVELFLQNFAKSGSVIFNDNVVNVNSSYNYGKLYVSYDAQPTYSFDKVMVRNNTYNVRRAELYNSFPAGTDTIISGNQYSGSKD